MTRKFHKQPLDDIALMHWPNKMTVESFVESLQKDLPHFLENMQHLKKTDKKHAEQWMEMFLAWMEFNTKLTPSQQMHADFIKAVLSPKGERKPYKSYTDEP
jgi:hypothetical protein